MRVIPNARHSKRLPLDGLNSASVAGGDRELQNNYSGLFNEACQKVLSIITTYTSNDDIPAVRWRQTGPSNIGVLGLTNNHAGHTDIVDGLRKQMNSIHWDKSRTCDLPLTSSTDLSGGSTT